MTAIRHNFGQLARRLRARQAPLILMYHRVADVALDPWKLAVHPDNFAAQMRVLAKERQPVSLDWMVQELIAGRRHQGTVAVTFDDAYRDVLQNAKPVLEEMNIPATVFVVSGALGKQHGFWWDRLANAVLTLKRMPDAIELSFITYSDRHAVEAIRASGNITSLHLRLWEIASQLDTIDEREAAIDEVQNAFGITDMPSVPVMSREDIGTLVEGGLITVGAHTTSHPMLSSLKRSEQRAEMQESRQFLEELVGQDVPRLAYPFGDFDSRSEDIARELGFAYAVSTQPGTVKYAGNLFRLARYDMRNWTGPQFRRKLKWFN